MGDHAAYRWYRLFSAWGAKPICNANAQWRERIDAHGVVITQHHHGGHECGDGSQQHSILAVWSAFGLGYIGVRALTLGLRVRGNRWLGPAPSLRDRESRHARSVGFTMKAIVYSETGAPSVLHLVERPVPEPEAGEVRIRIVVSGVNPTPNLSQRRPPAPD